MFRFFAFVLVFGLAALRGHAQFGVQVGGAITAVQLTQGYTAVERGWNFRYNAGVLYRIRRLGGFKKLDVQPTLQYIVKGSTDNLYAPTGVAEIYARLRYVELSAPFILRFHDEGFRNYTYNLGLGPYAAVLASGKVVAVPLYKGNDTSRDLLIGNAAQNDARPLDAGLTLYASMKMVHVSAGFSYDYGLLNTSPKAGETAYNRSFSIFFGYLLR